jgi:hypothetical protein
LIDYRMTRWNTHQGKPHWWHAKVIDHPTERLLYSFVFAKSRPSSSDSLIIKDYGAVTETELVLGKDYLVSRSEDGLTVKFDVPHPRYSFGYIYRYAWNDSLSP